MTPWIVLIVVVALWWAMIGRRAARAEAELKTAKAELMSAGDRLRQALTE